MGDVNMEALLASIQDAKPWLARFTRKEYGAAYQEYRERFAPLYREAVLSAGEEGPAALAEVLLDSVAAGWKRQRPWNRSVAQLNDKQMVVCYLSPMLLEDPVCAPLAEKLREGWAARWPDDAYQVASMAKLRKGFRPTFLGIVLPFQKEEDED